MSKGEAEFQPRAQRFPIHVSVKYHECDKPDWHEGTTVNISRTGILFETNHDVPQKTELVLRLIFPAEITGSSAMDVICWGPVVRRDPDVSPGKLKISAAIQRYHFSTP